jgi:hypothetical protein
MGSGRQGWRSVTEAVGCPPLSVTGNVLTVTDEAPELVPADAVDTVLRFVRLVWDQGNLRAAWPLVDDVFRQSWGSAVALSDP